MSPPHPSDLSALYDRANAYYPTLPSALTGLLRQFVRERRLLECAVSLSGIGTLTMTRSGDQVTCDWLNGTLLPPNPESAGLDSALLVDAAVRAAQWVSEPAHTSPRPRHPTRSRTLPLPYNGDRLGDLHVHWTVGDGDEALILAQAPEIAQQLAFLAKRDEAQSWAAHTLGRPYGLIGLGRAARALDRFLEKAAPSRLPVLLTGEFGTETTAVAAMIHGLGPQRSGPFVQILAADPTGDPAAWLDRAAGGTLFIREVEALSPGFQSQLLHHMPSRLGQGSGYDRAPVRLIAATSVNLKDAARDGRFSRSLLSELDFLATTLPPLRERPEDLPALIGAALAQHGYGADTRITPDLLALCRAYAWPENGFELERVMARLAVMGDGGPIQRRDVQHHAPWLLPADPAPADAAAPPTDLDHWVRCAIDKDGAALNGHHAGLKRALFYLADHFARPITLDELAGQAHVSPSHLSYLFRTELQTSFKTLLGRLRLRKASELLLADQRQPITDIAMSVGFADLSHFEKSFRRHWGQSPREFRRDAGAADRH